MPNIPTKGITLAALLCLFLCGHSTGQDSKPSKQEAGPQGWANWRGPLHTGASPTANPPVEWNEEKNVRWKTKIPGEGISSPVIWDDMVIVTSAIGTERTDPNAAPQPEREEEGARRGGRRRGGRRGRRRAAPTKIHEFVVVAFNREDGSIAWQTKVAEAVPHESGHPTGSQASASPLTDGKQIYAFFGSRGLHCLDMKGKIIWSKQFGKMTTRNQFGEGASPAVHGDTIVIAWDHEGDSFICALNKNTGKEIWRKERDEKTGWVTPLIIEVDGKPQVIISAQNASRAYDLKTGDVVWTMGGMTGNCIPSPIFDDGLLYLMSGFRGASFQALKIDGAKGSLDDSEHLVWQHSKATSYVPSALVYKDHVYFLRVYSGRLTCLNKKTGEVAYEGESIEGLRQIYASPLGAAGRVYFTGRNGQTKVIRAGGDYEVLADNELNDVFDATAATVGEELFLRGRASLYCIAEGK